MTIATIMAFITLTFPYVGGSTCATVDSTRSQVEWTGPRGQTRTAEITDYSVPYWRYSRPIPVAVRQAEVAIKVGGVGAEIATVCSNSH